MERTESKSFQVHPSDEQYYIDVMQHFQWNLQSSQEIHVRDSHIETRNDKLYSVTESARYVKLIFMRPYNFPNKEKFVNLENEFFGMKYPSKTTAGCLSTGLIILGILGLFGGFLYFIMGAIKGMKSILQVMPFVVITVIVWGSALYGGLRMVKNANIKNKEIDELWKRTNIRRREILEECLIL